MEYWGYNDYELLYLAKENNDEALDIIFTKYNKLILKKANEYRKLLNFDDLCQEGKMILNKAILNFDESYNKTFTRYFEMLIEHRFIDLMRRRLRENKNVKFDNDEIDNYQFNNECKINNLILNETININYQKLSSFEQKVFKCKFIENMKVVDIAAKLSTSSVNISNAIQRIKSKIKK